MNWEPAEEVKKGPVVYSEDEHVIGTVIENGIEKDLYSKTIHGTIPSDAYGELPSGITYTKVYEMKGRLFQLYGDHNEKQIDIPFGFSNISTGQYASAFFDEYTGKLNFRVSSGYYGTRFDATVQYTKD